MRKKFVLFGFCLLFFASISLPQDVRKALLAGSWYPRNPEALSQLIDHFLKNVNMPEIPEGEVLAIIAPHAGYAFSGQVAAYAYKLVQNKNFDTAVILSPSHRLGFEGCSIFPKGGYETPLGIAPVDDSLAAELSKATGFGFIAQAHEAEHAVEIQVPFVQKTLPKAKIVPIVMGIPKKATIMRLAEGLKKVLTGKKALIIVSTDLSHFLTKEAANERDSKTIALIQDFKTNELIRDCERGENIMCGGGAVNTALLFGKDKASIKILRYSDSSQISQDTARVVGYLAAALIAEPKEKEFHLSDEDQQELLNLALSTVRTYVRQNRVPEYKPGSTALLQNRGAFVTLNKNGRLRGCIGFIEPLQPLYQAVMQASVYAACRDSRFLPVTKDELDEIEVEISVLTPLKKITNPNVVTIGKHGLVIEKQGKRGLLLPQVAVEHNWTREIFLERVCIKAGLAKNAWRFGADLFVFEAIVFH